MAACPPTTPSTTALRVASSPARRAGALRSGPAPPRRPASTHHKLSHPEEQSYRPLQAPSRPHLRPPALLVAAPARPPRLLHLRHPAQAPPWQPLSPPRRQFQPAPMAALAHSRPQQARSPAAPAPQALLRSASRSRAPQRLSACPAAVTATAAPLSRVAARAGRGLVAWRAPTWLERRQPRRVRTVRAAPRQL
jgi:hypothetical protein